MDTNTAVVWIVGEVCAMVTIVTICLTLIYVDYSAWLRRKDSDSQ